MTNDKTVTMPRELLERFIDWYDGGKGNFVSGADEMRALLAAPVVERQPVAWDSAKPSAPGAYWVRGNGLARDAIIRVIEEEGELRCNLHIRTTEDDFGYGYSIDQLSDEFEWLGPLFASPPAPVAVVLPEDLLLSGSEIHKAINHVLECDSRSRDIESGWGAELAHEVLRLNACLDKVKELNK